MRLVKICIIMIVIAAFFACSQFRDPYVGEYSSEAGGDVFLKITKTDGEYRYSTIENGAWDTPRPMRVVEESEYAYVVGKDCSKCMSGAIATEVVMLLQVKNGQTCDRIKFESEYMFISFLGIDFLYRAN